jgi:hypothetical protein
VSCSGIEEWKWGYSALPRHLNDVTACLTNVNNPSSPTNSVHEDIILNTLNTPEQETVRESKKSPLVGETMGQFNKDSFFHAQCSFSRFRQNSAGFFIEGY